MNVKVVAGGIILALVLAGMVGLVVVNDKGSDDGTVTNDSLLGTWHLIYAEELNLIDENHDPITRVEDCHIESYIFNPKDDYMKILISSVNNHFFKGKIAGTDIHGTADGHAINFTVDSASKPDHIQIFKGKFDGEHIALNIFTYDINHQLCAVRYAFYVNDVNSKLSPMIDHINLDMKYELVFSKVHVETDFAPGGNMDGRDTGVHQEYYRSHSMISLFRVLDDNGTEIGINIITSLGYSPIGTAYGTVVTSVIQGSDVHVYIGDMRMSDGKMKIFCYMLPLNLFSFVETEFNVPYYDGSDYAPVFISGKYEGTVTTYYAGNNRHDTREITKNFIQFNNTLYGKEIQDGIEYIWFGGLKGSHFLELEVRGADKDGSVLNGILTGSIKADGTITLTGTLFYRESGSPVGVQYVLSPVK